jgi:hypothetical protein
MKLLAERVLISTVISWLCINKTQVQETVGETEMQQYFQTLQNRMDIIEEAIVKFSSLEAKICDEITDFKKEVRYCFFIIGLAICVNNFWESFLFTSFGFRIILVVNKLKTLVADVLRFKIILQNFKCTFSNTSLFSNPHISQP